MQTYRIREGHTFHDAVTGHNRSGGQTIELEDDDARTHAARIQPVAPALPVQTSARPAGEKPAE